MTTNDVNAYNQSLMDRIVALSREIENLRIAYSITNDRLNNLIIQSSCVANELFTDAEKLKQLAQSTVEAAQLAENSSSTTQNDNLIFVARKSSQLATKTYQFVLNFNNLKLKKLNSLIKTDPSRISD